jgi:hypothetical protein
MAKNTAASHGATLNIRLTPEEKNLLDCIRQEVTDQPGRTRPATQSDAVRYALLVTATRKGR